jgi:hypothetical protein
LIGRGDRTPGRKAGGGHRRGWRLVGLVAAAIGVLGAIVVTVAYFTAERPPFELVERATQAVGQARVDRAEDFAPVPLQSAESALFTAKLVWQMQNTRWRPLRDFGVARTNAIDAVRLAGQASNRSLAVQDSLRTLATKRIARSEALIDGYHAEFGDMPLRSALRRRAAEGRVFLGRSRLALERGDLAEAASLAGQAEAAIGGAADRAEREFGGYLDALPRWQAEAAETIAWSKRSQATAIIVDKLGRACRVYKGGRLTATFPVELSTNWVGDKRHRGDKATPEGKYKVTRKRGRGATKYYKALDIDYPNAEDLARFRAAKRRGELPAGTSPGSLIEIHGDGGRGADWTEGCVALRNDHMDKVFAAAQVGTPVLIVGALAPPANSAESRAAKARSSAAR